MTSKFRSLGHPPRWAVLLVCCVAQFMVVLDVSVITVALPDIRVSLHMSASSEQWIINAYTLAFGGFLLLGGRASDLFGRRRLFLLGLALFTLSSLAGGLAQDGSFLIAARAAQGLGGAILAPATLSVLTTTFTDPVERRQALAYWAATAASGAAAGVLAGGVLTDLLNWRWVLFINVPVGVLLFAAAVTTLRESTAGLAHRHLDLAGGVTVTGGMTALVYAIISAQTRGWGSAATLTTFAGSILLLAAFVFVEARLAPHPLVPLRVFRHRALTTGNVIGLTNGAALFGMYIFLSLYLQQANHYSALRSGLAFLPVGLMTMVGAVASSRLVARIGVRRQLAMGMLGAAAGLGWLSQLTAGAPYASHVLIPLLLAGAGFGLSVVPLTMAGTSGVPPTQAGLASGLIQTSRQIGGAIGLAALGTAAAAGTATATRSHHEAAAAALTSGYDRAFGIAAVTLIAGVLLTALMPRPHHQPSHPAAATRAARPTDDPGIASTAEPPANSDGRDTARAR